jgi:large subunit ribosomal protein L15
MNLSQLKNENAKNRKRVGRGTATGHGKTSGRGHKGQKARSGYSRKPGFEGGQMPLNRRLPKRGFNHQKRIEFAVVNLDQLENNYNAGDTVTSESLVAAGLAHKSSGGVKVLGRGELTKALTLTVGAVSETARKQIEAAGGSITLAAPVAAKTASASASKDAEAAASPEAGAES